MNAETSPACRRFISQGFKHEPERDAPRYGMICLSSPNQRVFVNPETGYCAVNPAFRGD